MARQPKIDPASTRSSSPPVKDTYLSSTVVKEITKYGADLREFVRGDYRRRSEQDSKQEVTMGNQQELRGMLYNMITRHGAFPYEKCVIERDRLLTSSTN